MSEELRIRAMDFAIAARTSGEQDIVELAQRIYAFLDEDDVPLKDALAYAGDIVSNMPPPIPHQDLGKADQSPRSCTCHPDDRPPVPCAEKYAFSECVASIGFDTTEVRPGTVVIGFDGQIQSSDQLKEAFRASVEFEDDDVPTRRIR